MLALTPLLCVQYVETDLQRLQMKLKVEPRHLHEAIEAEYMAAAKAKPVRRPIDLDPAPKPGECERGCVVTELLLPGCLLWLRRVTVWMLTCR
jgi:hypothetical protein